MQRRRFTKLLATGLLSFGASIVFTQPASAQTRPRATTVPRTAATPQQQQRPVAGPRPATSTRPGTPAQMEMKISPEVEAILQKWEQNSSKVHRLRGTYQRYVYDSVFSAEKRSEGKFWFEYPDKGRIDFDQPSEMPPQSQKLNSEGRPYSLQPDTVEKWICDGVGILQIAEADKTYNRFEIPPSHRGENIMDAPLPFLFGMKAEKAKARYHLALGAMHNPDGERPGIPPQIHLVAQPKRKDIAQEWRRAEVVLDAEYYMPRAIRLYNPAGTTETVYVFNRANFQWNDKIWFPNPFKLSVSGYKLLQNVQAKGDAGAPGAKIR